MTWTREHDRILAEKCEGFKVRRWDELPIAQQHYDYCPDELFIGESIHDRLPHYLTDIAACIRAAEGWVMQNDGRYYLLMSDCYSNKKIWRPRSAELHDRISREVWKATTLHEALYEAVTHE